MEIVFYVLVIGALLSLWVVSALMLSKYGKAGWEYFIAFFIALLGVSGIFFLALVVPVLDCRGFLCGIGPILIFAAVCFIMVLSFPIIMMTAVVNKLKRKFPDVGNKKFDDELIH